MKQHTLIIGGTGMLAPTSIYLAGHCEVLTIVGSNPHSLESFNKKLNPSRCKKHLLNLDWSQPKNFIRRLTTHTENIGAPNLIIAWLHTVHSGPALAVALSDKTQSSEFYHVCGSDMAKPNNPQRLDLTTIPANVGYHQITLGFHVDTNSSRWLSQQEINQGLQHAIATKQTNTVVGTTKPWSLRP